jgi:hypothetical protein
MVLKKLEKHHNLVRDRIIKLHIFMCNFFVCLFNFAYISKKFTIIKYYVDKRKEM